MAHERIVTRCPECGTSNLFIGTGGHLTCGLIGCKRPSVEDSIDALKTDNAHLRASLAAADRILEIVKCFTGAAGVGTRRGVLISEIQWKEFCKARDAYFATLPKQDSGPVQPDTEEG